MIIYTCKECDKSKIEYRILPKLKCDCGKYMDAEEWE